VPPGSCGPPRHVVDSALLAAKIAAVRDATARVRAVLPASADAFIVDRTAREVVTLNLFVAIQACLDLAAHWLADAGWDMPATYADVFGASTASSTGAECTPSPARTSATSTSSAQHSPAAHAINSSDWTLTAARQEVLISRTSAALFSRHVARLGWSAGSARS